MIESGYYPPGAEFDPNAPWNQEELPEKTFDVCVSQTLSKSTKVTTNDYIPEDNGLDEDGMYYEDIDTSCTDWKEAYSGNQSSTPLELLEAFKTLLEEIVNGDNDSLQSLTSRRSEFKHLIEECEGWVEDELEIIEE